MNLKKLASVVLVSAVALGGLTACGDDKKEVKQEPQKQEERQEPKKKGTVKKQEKKAPVNEESEVKNFETKDTPEGKITYVRKNENVGVSETSGPFRININKAGTMIMEPKDKKNPVFKGKEKLNMVIVQYEIENTGDTALGSPVTSTMISTNTKEQVDDPDYLFSNNVFGDIMPGAVKKGNVVYLVESDVKDITKITVSIPEVFDDEGNTLGDAFSVDIDL